MLPASRNLTIYAGDTFEMSVRLREKTVDGLPGNPVNLAGCTPKSQIRATEDSSTVIAEFSCALDTDPTTGIINVSLAASTTATLVGGVWDLQLTFPDGKIRTYVKGNVSVQKEVTRV